MHFVTKKCLCFRRHFLGMMCVSGFHACYADVMHEMTVWTIENKKTKIFKN